MAGIFLRFPNLAIEYVLMVVAFINSSLPNYLAADGTVATLTKIARFGPIAPRTSTADKFTYRSVLAKGFGVNAASPTTRVRQIKRRPLINAGIASSPLLRFAFSHLGKMKVPLVRVGSSPAKRT